MRPENVRFLYVDAEIEKPRTDDNDIRRMEAIEITKPDGNVSVFPADAVNDESGQRYCDLFSDKYAAFKADPNSDRIATLKTEVAEREAELKALSEQSKDDARVQKNLGYGKQPDPDSARSAADHTRRRGDDGGHQGATVQPDAAPNFDDMGDDDLRKWISDNGGDEQRSNASHASLVHAAEALNAKIQRRNARAAAKAED